MATVFAQIKTRRDTPSNWNTEDTVLAAGELAVELTTGLLKIGDGVTAWSALPYYSGLATFAVVGSTASPTNVVEPIAAPTKFETLYFIQGNGGPQTISNIGAASSVGAKARIVVSTLAKQITLNGAGNIKVNGGAVTLGMLGPLQSVIDLFYDGLNWVEVSRNGI